MGFMSTIVSQKKVLLKWEINMLTERDCYSLPFVLFWLKDTHPWAKPYGRIKYNHKGCYITRF